jgi:hypothetical protein
MAPAPNWDGGPRATLKWGRPRHLGARRASGGSMPPERAPRSGRTVGAWLHRPSLRPRAPARETLTRRAMGWGRSSARVIRAGCFRTLSAGPMSIVGTCPADLPLRSMQIFDLRPATAQASWRRAKLGRAGMIGMSRDPCRRILDRHRVGVLEHHSMAVSTLHRPRSCAPVLPVRTKAGAPVSAIASQSGRAMRSGARVPRKIGWTARPCTP